MNEIDEHIYKTLKADTTLRSLLSKVADPYGIYFFMPPVQPPLPIVTYRPETVINDGGINELPRQEEYLLTVYGDNFNAVLEGVYDALQNNTDLSTYISVPTLSLLMLKWTWTGSVMYDENFKVYFRPSRFTVKYARL